MSAARLVIGTTMTLVRSRIAAEKRLHIGTFPTTRLATDALCRGRPASPTRVTLVSLSGSVVDRDSMAVSKAGREQECSSPLPAV